MRNTAKDTPRSTRTELSNLRRTYWDKGRRLPGRGEGARPPSPLPVRLWLPRLARDGDFRVVVLHRRARVEALHFLAEDPGQRLVAHPDEPGILVDDSLGFRVEGPALGLVGHPQRLIENRVQRGVAVVAVVAPAVGLGLGVREEGRLRAGLVPAEKGDLVLTV